MRYPPLIIVNRGANVHHFCLFHRYTLTLNEAHQKIVIQKNLTARFQAVR